MRISDWSSDVCSSDLLLRDHLAAEPLLESVEARGFTPLHLSAHEQFAIDHRILIERRDQFGERPADLLAATAVDARLAAPAHDLDTKDRKSTRLNSSH